MGTNDLYRVPSTQSPALSASLTAATYPSRAGVCGWFGHSSATLGDACDAGENGPIYRLQELTPGTRVRLAPGRVGTLLGGELHPRDRRARPRRGSAAR